MYAEHFAKGTVGRQQQSATVHIKGEDPEPERVGKTQRRVQCRESGVLRIDKGQIALSPQAYLPVSEELVDILIHGVITEGIKAG